MSTNTFGSEDMPTVSNGMSMNARWGVASGLGLFWRCKWLRFSLIRDDMHYWLNYLAHIDCYFHWGIRVDILSGVDHRCVWYSAKPASSWVWLQNSTISEFALIYYAITLHYSDLKLHTAWKKKVSSFVCSYATMDNQRHSLSKVCIDFPRVHTSQHQTPRAKAHQTTKKGDTLPRETFLFASDQSKNHIN